jgi:hypothetical protein
MFGVPSAFVGFLMANRIARSSSLYGVLLLGVFVVICASLLFGLLAGVFTSRITDAWMVALGVLIFEAWFFKGIPFVIGALAALGFREAVQRSPGWWEWE